MVRVSTLMGGLVLAITTYGSPLPQSEDLSIPPEGTATDATLTLTDFATPPEETATDGTLTLTGPPPAETSINPLTLADSLVDTSGQSDTPELQDGIPLDQPLDLALTNSVAVAMEAACDLDPREPKTWAASGAELLLNDYLKANGPEAWVNGLTRKVTNRNEGLACGQRNSALCPLAPVPTDCNTQNFYITRFLAASVKSTFDVIGETLQDVGITGALNMKSILEDFKLPDIPEAYNVPLAIKNVAFGVGVAEQAVGLIPGGNVASSFLALVGIGLNAGAENMKDEEPKEPKYDEIEAGMNKYLATFFTKTRDEMDRMLEALFGEVNGKGSDDPLLRQMIERMGKLGVRELNKDVEFPIAEIFKGGEFLVPIQKNDFVQAFNKGFKGMQGALIGNLLTGLQVYVERQENAPESGPELCTALGQLLIDNQCYTIKRKPFSGEAPFRLEDQYLQKLGEYGVDLHTLIRSARDCNNGEANNEFTGTGEYGKCWFGLKIATRVSDTLVDRYKPNTANGFQCGSKFRGLDKLPSYIYDEKDNNCNGRWREVPNYQRCELKMYNDGSFNDSGLARYRMRIEGRGIDVGQICPYLHDGRRCVFGSNRRCVQEGNGYLMEISFAHGSIGNDHFNDCHNSIIKQFKGDNFCFDFPAGS